MCQVHILKFKITIIILGFRYVVDTSVACAIGPSVTTSSTDFSFQNLIFWNLFEFSVAEIT